ncbi:unnamed protein product [Protopolystoma xenopodis]|uniref:Uncharacterized protein n=1 Tax=Protopolystoma xenopodis TaxID=117903 RepID=A0A448WIY1_9PLAT|nr:unnamed protein product [Protopolystoma xenopodis]
MVQFGVSPLLHTGISSLIDPAAESTCSTITRGRSGHSLGSTSTGTLGRVTGLINSTRSPLLDRWLTSQDERLMAWCQALAGR